ncbi:hypothetical protein [Sulfitobacter geojensis]|uniref:hypothetical protein n=1 Tax=Sulfitobacter geojensis TaxID=1342299 RepID=UPI000469AAF9|nr:hypothetical protein [Sulfitobacter geojensis]NYI28208.1 hypothetical protein [Sulfitobacter geojensis]
MPLEEFEIEIQSTANEINKLVASGFYGQGPDWVKAWYGLSLDWSDTDPEYVVYPPKSIDLLLKQAESQLEMFNLATFVVGTRLACDADLDPKLREFAAEFLLGNFSPPKARPGRPSKQTWGRDFIVINAMSYLEMSRKGPMTQNNSRTSNRDHDTTASEIVEAAIGRSKLPNLNRVQIEKIWARSRSRSEYNETRMLRDFYLLDEANDIE